MQPELLAQWEHHLRVARNASPHTVRAYVGDLNDLADYLDRTGSGSLAGIGTPFAAATGLTVIAVAAIRQHDPATNSRRGCLVIDIGLR